MRQRQLMSDMRNRGGGGGRFWQLSSGMYTSQCEIGCFWQFLPEMHSEIIKSAGTTVHIGSLLPRSLDFGREIVCREVIASNACPHRRDCAYRRFTATRPALLMMPHGGFMLLLPSRARSTRAACFEDRRSLTLSCVAQAATRVAVTSTT